MTNRTAKSWHAWVIAGLLASTTAVSADFGFEVGNAQGNNQGSFFGLGNLGFFPGWNHLYGRLSDKPSDTSKTRLSMKTYKKVRYEAFRELRRVLEPKGWESIRADDLDAMEREGFGHGEGRCNLEIRFLNSEQSLVAADYEAVPDCTIEQAMKAVKDSLRAESLLE